MTDRWGARRLWGGATRRGLLCGAVHLWSKPSIALGCNGGAFLPCAVPIMAGQHSASFSSTCKWAEDLDEEFRLAASGFKREISEEM